MRTRPELTLCRILLALLCAAVPAIVQSQEVAAPLLTLDTAIQLAVDNNRSLKIARLEIDKTKWSVEAAKTNRLPAFKTYAFTSSLLTPFAFTFEQGAFGTVNGTPVPSETTKIENDQSFNVYVVAQAIQPLSQLYKINLGVRQQKLSTLYSSEQYRAKRQSIVKEVKQTYYKILQNQSAVDATQAAIRQYQELDRVVLQKISVQQALQSESLEVKARLAQEQYNIVKLRNNLDVERERLNDLLGRALDTDFRVQEISDPSPEEFELKVAQQSALSHRPELRQAEINVQKADYDRRIAKADYIPDVGIAVHYVSPFNITVVPQNITSAGIEFSWEPFDWGRRRDNVNQKEISLQQTKHNLDETRSQILQDVNAKFRKMAEMRVLLHVATATREAANEKLREITDKYQVQSVLLRDVLQQQSAVASANNSYEQALLGFWDAKAEFEKAVGED